MPGINVAGDIDVRWSSALRTGAFVILLLRAGLGLKLDILRKNKVCFLICIILCTVYFVILGVKRRFGHCQTSDDRVISLIDLPN